LYVASADRAMLGLYAAALYRELHKNANCSQTHKLTYNPAHQTGDAVIA